MLAERDLGRNIRSSKQTLDQYLDVWLSVSAQPRLRVKTYRDYSSLLDRYIRPRLGTLVLGKLLAVEIQALYKEMLDRGLSSGTIRYTHAVFSSALNQAVRWKLILANPAEDVDLPRHSRSRFTVLDVEESRRFIAAISDHEHEALFAVAITTGMRPSEYLALTWSDVDFDRATVSVSKTVAWWEGKWYFEGTKRERSRRMIKLQNWVVALLRKCKETAMSTGGDPRSLIFRDADGCPFRQRQLARVHFKPLLRSAGLPNIRLYDLRHTAATLALSARVSPKIVSEQLGHASVAFTLQVYSHVLPHMQDTAVLAIEALLLNH